MPGDDAPNPEDPWSASRPIVGDVRGRASALNPSSRFDRLSLNVLPEHREQLRIEHPDGAQIRTNVIDDDSREVINRVDSPDLPFHWTLNPYRGCEHGCAYCYARPGHEFLGLSAGLDFETIIHAKRRAPALLRATLSRDTWQGDAIMLSGVTDPYQPIERDLRITRACLEVAREFAQPISIVTKSSLVTRDLDILTDLARRSLAHVYVSLTSLDNALSGSMEPRASSPSARLGAIRDLAGAGVPVGVMTAPIIPGLNDREIPALLAAAAEAGASTAAYILLRLPLGVKELFLEWLSREFPHRASHVESLIRQCRDGRLNDSRAFSRFRGEGPIAEQIRATHALFRKRCGLDAPMPPLDLNAFALAKRERAGVQRGLFD